MKKNQYFPKKSNLPLRSIRYFCFECMGWDRRSKDSGKPFDDVKACTDEICPLYDFRFGKNPFHTKRSLSHEHLNALQKGRRAFLENDESNQNQRSGSDEG